MRRWMGEFSTVVECLLIKYEAVSLVLIAGKITMKRRRKRRREGGG